MHDDETPFNLAGVAIDLLTFEQSIEVALKAFEQSSARIYFVNAHCVNVANQEPTYSRALQEAEFVFNDGAGVELAARLLGKNVQANLGGTDWIPAFFEALGAKRPARIYLLGSKQRVVLAVAKALPERWSNLSVVGWHHGFFTKEEDILKEIELVRPDLLLVAMGVPKQELFLDRHWQRLVAGGVRLGIAGGAILDFMAGAVPRAPIFMRKARLEWLFRLYHEPTRLWKRYLWGNMRFFIRILKQRLIDDN